MLASNGVLGYSYFTRNRHVDAIQRLLRQHKPERLIPVSRDRRRLVVEYLLSSSHLQHLVKDDMLIDFLASSDGTNRNVAFTEAEVNAVLALSGFQSMAYLPVGYSHPFGTSVSPSVCVGD